MIRLNDTLTCSADGWTLTESGWDADRSLAVGSNVMVGNGYLGYRGTSPEQGADGYVALVVTDTYDMADGRWRELCTVPNPLLVRATVDGTSVGVATADHVETELDLRTAQMRLTFSQRVGDATVEVTCRRVASAVDLHLLAQHWELRADRPVSVALETDIDTVVWSLNGDHFADMTCSDGVAVGHTTERGTRVVVAHEVHAEPATTVTPHAPLVVETLASVWSSNDTDDPDSRARAGVRAAAAAGYASVAAASAQEWARIWERMDVQIDGAPVDQASLRFCAYHNRIATPAHTDHLPIGARGLSCQAYQGAAFWDQEVYNLPAFLLTEPEIARRLLVYRHKTLDGARRKAARHGYDGAFFAWISGDTGDELCPDVFFADVLTGRPIRNHFNLWQIHISPDIVTTIDQYVRVTGDEQFVVDHGAEVAFEVARFLRSRVLLDERHGTYHCIRLLGPDEWHENVDDNAFTSYQVRSALDVAVRTHHWMAQHAPDQLGALHERLGLTHDEVAAWARVRDHLYLPAPDPQTGLIEQFDGFFDLEDVTPDDLRTRLLHPQEYWGWPNGIAVRTQVSKQADVPVLLWQHRDEFSDEVVEANYRYYEPRCAHGSTLSHPPFGFSAIRVGDLAKALEHFRATATVDLLTTAHAVVGGTFIGGIHTAACAGAYQLAVMGFGGLDVVDGELRIDPSLPPEWTSLTYPVTFRGRRLRVTVTGDSVDVALVEGPPLDVTIRGERRPARS
jgi:kojibiose phosphorylase